MSFYGIAAWIFDFYFSPLYLSSELVFLSGFIGWEPWRWEVGGPGYCIF